MARPPKNLAAASEKISGTANFPSRHGIPFFENLPFMDSQPDTPSSIDAHTAAVQGLFLKYQPAVRGLILSMVPDFSLADDLLQETFLVVTRKAHTFTLGTSFPAWVKTIARYKVLETIRARRSEELLSEEVIDALMVDHQDLPANVDTHLQLLEQCLSKLAPQARRAIDFRYRNDHRPPEIANLMGCTVQSVNVTLSRARAFLRDCVIQKLANPAG